MQDLSTDSMYDIMYNLSYSDIKKLCRTDKTIKSLCDNDYFWMRMVERDFGKEVAAAKPGDKSYRGQYYYLIHLNGYSNKAVKNGRLDGVMISQITTDTLALAVEHGYVNILDWLLSQGYVLQQNFIDKAIEANRWDMVEWLMKHDLMPNSYNITYALQHNKLDSYYKLRELGIQQNHQDIIFALLHKNFDIAGELFALPLPPSLFPILTRTGNIAALDWLYDKGVLPDEEDYIVAMSHNSYDVIRWMIHHDIPTGYLQEQALRYMRMDIVDILLEENVFNAYNATIIALEEDDLELFKWLHQTGYLDWQAVDDEMGERNYSIGRWMKRQGIISEEEEYESDEDS